MAGRRAFGSVRKLKSGRWQIPYYGPDGIRRPAPGTYERKRDAELQLSKLEADISRDDWFDPEAGKVKLGVYGTNWLAVRKPDLAETTHERYEIAFRLYVKPQFGNRPINEIRESDVRTWRADLLTSGKGKSSVAKAYRVLRAMLNAAVAEGAVKRNPCRIKGADSDQSEERPVLTVDEVLRVVAALPPRYRMMALLATFTSLRFGELAALSRRQVDLSAGFVTVLRSQAQLNDGRLLLKDPKSEAGRRAVPIPDALLDELKSHLDQFAQNGGSGRVFVGPKGGLLRRQNFRKIWIKAVTKSGIPEITFHDLRHTGNTLVAENGATIRDLMERMGHSTPRAAMIYLHVSKGRSKHLSDGLSTLIEAARAETDSK